VLNPQQGRRSVIRPINPCPILRALAQAFANRIHQDIAGFLFQFVMIAQAMIEKITLPIHAMFSRDELLPIPDRRLHSWFARKRNNRVQMIGHEHAQAAMPARSLVVEFHGVKHGIASFCAAELVFSRRHTVDGDKEPAALGHPLPDCVRQFFADGQIHARSVARRSHGGN
jgi:hypothetical protein